MSEPNYQLSILPEGVNKPDGDYSAQELALAEKKHFHATTEGKAIAKAVSIANGREWQLNRYSPSKG